MAFRHPFGLKLVGSGPGEVTGSADPGPTVQVVVPTQRLAEEALGRFLVALGAEQGIDGLAGAIDRPVEVAPLSIDPM
jgi:hypothetical protein